MTAPALLVAVPLLAGVLAGSGLSIDLSLAGGLLLLDWLVTAVALVKPRRPAVTGGIVAGFFISGLILGNVAAADARQPPLLAWFQKFPPDGAVHVTGVLREDAGRGPNGVSLAIDAVEVSLPDATPQRVRGGIRASVAGTMAMDQMDAWRAGRTVAVDLQLREPLDYRDPGVPSDRQRLARQGIVLLGTIKSAALVSIVRKGGPLGESAAALRAFVRSAAARAIAPWHARSAAVATAILIGDRGGLDPEDERRLQEAGTYHVIAISGGNIALLTALLVVCGRAARIPARPTAAASMVLLAFYGYAAGLAPSVLRATLAGVVYLAGRATDQRGAALNAVAVAGAVAAVAAPLTLLDPGFILSFGATLAIVIAASRLLRLPPRRREDRLRRWGRVAASAILTLFAATLCAEIALAPVGARLFGRVSFAGLLLNFAAIPLMSIIQVSALLTVVLSAASSTAALACGWLVQAGTRMLLWSAELVDVAPWLVLDVPPPSVWLIAGWYAAWGLLLLSRPRGMRAIASLIAAATGVLILAGLPSTRAVVIPHASPGWTRVVFFDVGQGDATLVQPPGGSPLLIDAGGVPGSSFDLGRRVTLPAAWAFGVSRLAALVLTHGDPDHVGGAPPILRALRPREIWDGIPVPGYEPMERIREAAQQAGIPWIERRTGESLAAGGLEMRVLNPLAPTWERRRVRNDDSIVLEIHVGDVAFVLPGDITKAVEPDVLAASNPAPLVILKAPHHGSAGSSSQPFVDALHPAAVIFSAGRRNPFGHPAPVVVDRYRAASAQVFSTADDGAIVVDTDGKEVRVWTWTGRREDVHRRATENSETRRVPPQVRTDSNK